MTTHPVFLPGKSHGQRSLEGYCLWGHRESHMTEPGCTHNVVNVFVGGGYGNPEKGHFPRV